MSAGGFERLILRVVDLVNRRRPLGSRVRDSMASKSSRDALLQGARLAADRGLTVGNLAEISLRLSDSRFAINARGAWFSSLTDDDLLVVSVSGDWASDPSRLPEHLDWHRRIYRTTAAKAVLLCQPTIATAAAMEGLLPQGHWLIDARKAVGEVQCVDPGDRELERALKAGVAVMLLRGYGVLAWGEAIDQVLARVESLERLYAVGRAAKTIRSERGV